MHIITRKQHRGDKRSTKPMSMEDRLGHKTPGPLIASTSIDNHFQPELGLQSSSYLFLCRSMLKLVIAMFQGEGMEYGEDDDRNGV